MVLQLSSETDVASEFSMERVKLCLAFADLQGGPLLCPEMIDWHFRDVASRCRPPRLWYR